MDEVDSTEEEISKPVETFDEDASLSDEMDIEFTEPKEKTKYVVPKDDPVKGIDPLPFPFFSLQAGKGEHKPCGTLPLIFYYGKRLIPRTVSRQSGECDSFYTPSWKTNVIFYTVVHAFICLSISYVDNSSYIE